MVGLNKEDSMEQKVQLYKHQMLLIVNIESEKNTHLHLIWVFLEFQIVINLMKIFGLINLFTITKK
jgi:hypothetical protein